MNTFTRGLLALLTLAFPGPRAAVRPRTGVPSLPAERAWANRELWGVPSDAALGQRATIAAHEARRWAHLLPGAQLAAPLGAQAWVNLGPASADEEYNDTVYHAVDSGRPTAIAVDPRDPNIVYVAEAGGGIWKTYDFISGAPDPHWLPIGESLGTLAIGALALDPSHPDTVYAGLGDAFDQSANGVYKSTDGGGTWVGPLALVGRAGAAGSTRDLKVDPGNPNRVWALTNAGLFLSTDAGNGFTEVNLPGASGGAGAELWSMVWTGGQTWVVSGANYDANSQFTGDLWLTDDGGASWRSLNASPGLPAAAGRMTLAAGNAGRAGGAVVYAWVSNPDGSAHLGFWRSLDGGRTWADASGTLLNPTYDSTCNTVDVGREQAWYNQAIAVDPSNDDNVIAGGSLCSVRTTSGTSAQPQWENASVWLNYLSDSTVSGELPYVHADWHAAIVVLVNGVAWAIAGTDGGIFSSSNLFAAGSTMGSHSANPVAWAGNNKGLVTHLMYSVASGDPASGNPDVVLGGMQDNGTRIRVPGEPTTFNQVIGGDGVGTAVGKGTDGEFYWGTVVTQYPGAYLYCRASQADCTHGTSWQAGDPPVSSTQFGGFTTRFDPVPTDPTGGAFLTNTTAQVWLSNSSGTWTAISPDFSPDQVRHLRASPRIAKLYGATLSGGKYAVTSDGASWTTSQQLSSQGETFAYATALDFPPTTPSGAQPGDVYIAATAATQTQSGNVVPDAAGHLFITRDRGTTWTPIHGDGSGDDLPNVSIFAARYDPSDLTNQTLYVATDLGVYRTTNGGNTWERFGAGLPMVRVTDLFVASSGGLLRVSTYGRGVWEIYPSSSAPAGVSGDGDYDHNLALDYRDLAALTTRMGTDPSTSGWPTYSWIVDVAPSNGTSAIDDADLTTLLAGFGGHP